MLEYEVGKTAILYGTFAVDDVPTDPTNLQVTIYYDGSVVLGPVSPTKISVGYYNYEFTVPDDWTPDFYSALYTGTLNGVNFKETDVFKVIQSAELVAPAAPSGYYCTLADVQKYLYGVDFSELGDYDSYIIDSIPACHERVNMRTGRNWLRQTRVDHLDGNDMHSISLPYNPVITVSSCSIMLYPSTAWYTFTNIYHENVRGTIGKLLRTQDTIAEYESCDLLVDCATGIIKIPDSLVYLTSTSFPYWDRTFVMARRNIEVAYTCGYLSTDLPYEITELCARYAALDALEWAGSNISQGASSRSTSGASASWGSIPFQGLIEKMQLRIDDILDNYRRPGVT